MPMWKMVLAGPEFEQSNIMPMWKMVLAGPEFEPIVSDCLSP
jgi:hypothetical protein